MTAAVAVQVTPATAARSRDTMTVRFMGSSLLRERGGRIVQNNDAIAFVQIDLETG
jgi:hypothetical protein